MFDVSFSELMVIAVVALVVIGPERLPRVARTAGHLLGRLQRYVNNVKADINREMHMEDLKRFEQQVRSQVGEIQSSVTSELLTVEQGVNEAVGLDAAKAPADAPTSPAITPSPADGAVPPGLTSAPAEPSVGNSSASTHG